MSKIQLLVDGVQVYSNESSGYIPPVVAPYVPPVVTPPPSGSTNGIPPLNMLGGVWPIPPMTGSGDTGFSVWFVADLAVFPFGIELKLIDDQGSSLPKELVISTAPFDFNPVGGQAAGSREAGTSGSIIMKFGPALKWYDCSLVPGGTYFANVRALDRGTAHGQFIVTPRLS